MSGVCDIYLDACRQRHRDDDRMRRGTLSVNVYTAETDIVPYIGSVKARKLTPLRVDQFVQDLRSDADRPRKPLAVKRAIDFLRKALTEAQRLDLIKRNVVRDAPPRTPKIIRPALRIPSKDEITLLLSSASPDEAVVLEVACFTGLRCGEIAGLTWSNIDLFRRCITVAQAVDRFGDVKCPKTKAGIREVPISAALARTLQKFRKRSRVVTVDGRTYDAPDLLFYRIKAGTGSAPQFSAKPPVKLHHQVWQKAAQRAGLVNRKGFAKFHFHSLRHVAASLFIESGLAPKVVQVMMGHASIHTTFNTYGHLFPENEAARRAVHAISRQFGR